MLDLLYIGRCATSLFYLLNVLIARIACSQGGPG
jgi:hypothetical protein